MSGTAVHLDGGALRGEASNRGEASATRTRVHQSRRHHQGRVRARGGSRHRQPQHAAARQAPRRRSDEHLLVLPQEGRPAQRDDRPRAAPVCLRHALRRGQGLARDVAQSRAHDAKDVPGQPDSVRPDSHSVGAEPARGEARRRRRSRRRSRAWPRPACRPRTPSTPTPRCRCMCADRLCCSGFDDKNRAADEGPATSRRRWSIDPETAPLLAQVTAKGHHIGAADEKNFEFGLECILDHAERLIDEATRSRRRPHARRPRLGRDAQQGRRALVISA